MSALGNALLTVAVVCVLTGVVFSMMIVGALQARGVKINWFLIRLYLVTKYLGQYRDLTRQETGRPGWLYYSYITLMVTALVAAIAGVVLRAM